MNGVNGAWSYGTAAENTATDKNFVITTQHDLASANMDIRLHMATLQYIKT